jgi:group II intron reverse transcriptase/maturase
MGELFERAISIKILNMAFEEELSRDGPSGIDRQKPKDFANRRQANLQHLHSELKDGSYRSLSVLRHSIPKKSGGFRPLGIHTVRDRIVQRALMMTLKNICERHFLDCSHGYRPRRSTETALQHLLKLTKQRLIWIYEADIEDCFGSVEPELMGAELEKLCQDAMIRHLVVNQILNCGALEWGYLRWDCFGLPQGSPLSPLLANVYLHPFDCELTEAGYHLVRYADDFLILAESEAAAEQAGNAAENALLHRQMRPSPDKTQVISLAEGIEFLGFAIDNTGVSPHRKAIQALRYRLRQELEDSQERAPIERMLKLTQIIRGWRNYYPSFGNFQPFHPEVALAAAEVALSINDRESAKRFIESADPLLLQPLAQRLKAAKHKIGQSPAQSTYFPSTQTDLQGEQQMSIDYTQARNAMRAERRNALEQSYKVGGSRSKSLSLTPDLSPLAIEIAQLRHNIHLSPDNMVLYHQLADAYIRSGQHVLAYGILQCIAQTPISDFVMVSWEPDGPPLNLNTELLERYLGLFRGYEDMLSRAVIQRDGKLSYQPFARCLDLRTLGYHLTGEAIFALYPVGEGDACYTGGIEVGATRREWLRNLHDDQARSIFVNGAKRWILGVGELFYRIGIPILLEDTGGERFRLWFFLQDPIASSRIQSFLQTMLREVPPLPNGLAFTYFPQIPEPARYPWGQAVTLPLGAHPALGYRSRFLMLPDGEPISAEAGLKNISQVTPNELDTRLMHYFQRKGVVGLDVNYPMSQQLLDRCIVLKLIYEKLQVTRYLEYSERVSLLYSFGSLGSEGLRFLHALFSLCHDYRHQNVERFIAKRRPFPISCPRLRDKHCDLLRNMQCRCQFSRLPKGGYPSPVLHVLPADQAFKQVAHTAPNPTEHTPRPNASPDKPVPAIPSARSEPVINRGDVPSCIDKAERAVPAAELPNCGKTMRDVRDTSLTEPQAKVMTPEQAREVGRYYIELCRHLQGVQASLTKVSTQLGNYFEQSGSEELDTSAGVVRRRRSRDGSWTFIIPGGDK